MSHKPVYRPHPGEVDLFRSLFLRCFKSIKPIHPKIPIILLLILETKSGEKRGAVASQNSLLLTAQKAENRIWR
jgi:hypothetical protein